jgi:hypothetical protein
MRIRNEIEEAVRAEVEIQKDTPAGELHICWCALCAADVTALAMTILPPRYSTDSNTRPSSHGSGTGAVRSAVFTSIKRVARRPKHNKSIPESRAAKVRLVNFNYEEGAAAVASLSRRTDLPCVCRDCLTHTLAFALNRYPPKYGVLHAGRSNLPEYQRDYLRHELGIIISHAASVVASHPRHN